jgi:small multidrug resistance family-3 protein
MIDLIRALGLFVLAGLCEIGGGYLMWQWWRGRASWPVGLLGSLVLVLYGVVPTYQSVHFGRAYAAYGGVFVVMALLWSRVVDGVHPDAADLVGAAVCLAGVAVIMFWPR